MRVFSLFRCWFDQNNSEIQLINLASLTFLDSEVMFVRLQNLGMMCIIYINIYICMLIKTNCSSYAIQLKKFPCSNILEIFENICRKQQK